MAEALARVDDVMDDDLGGLNDNLARVNYDLRAIAEDGLRPSNDCSAGFTGCSGQLLRYGRGASAVVFSIVLTSVSTALGNGDEG